MWPLDKRNRIANHVTFYEAGGFEKVGDIDKAATILQYALEGRLTACTLLQMVSPHAYALVATLGRRTLQTSDGKKCLESRILLRVHCHFCGAPAALFEMNLDSREFIPSFPAFPNPLSP
jgi:hypothetical protein